MDQFSHLSPLIDDDTNPLTKIINFHPVVDIVKSTMKDNLGTGNNNNNNNHEISENCELINKSTETIQNCIENNQILYNNNNNNNCTNVTEDNQVAIIHEEYMLTATPSDSIDNLNNYETIVDNSILLNTVENPSSIQETDFTNSNESSTVIINNNYVCMENYNALVAATVEHDEDVQTTASIEYCNNKAENYNNLEYEEDEEEEDIRDIAEEADEEEEVFQMTEEDCIIKSDAVENVANILQEQLQDNIDKHLPKAFDAIRTQHGYTKKRKRRRIVLLNDEESSEQSDQEENEKDREILLKDETQTNKILLNVNNKEYQVTDISDIPQQLFENEKPKPKSKKISTKIIKEFEARALLQSAVLIQAIDSKKKKIRVLDSDEDDDDNAVTNINETDLTDIGLVDPICTEDLSIANILINEDIINSNFQLDEIPIDKLEKIIPIDNPIIEQSVTVIETAVVGSDDFGSDEEETEIYIPNIQDEDDYDDGNIISNDECEALCEDNNDTDKNILISAIDTEENHITCDDLLNPTADTTELYINTNNDPNDNEQNYENNLDLETEFSTNTNMENVIEEKELELDDKDPFFDYSSTTSEEYLPNDLYFGTPDKQVISPQIHRGRPRGRPPLHQSQTRTNGNNNLENNTKSNGHCRSVSRGGNTSRRGRPPLTNKISNRKSQTTYALSSSSSDLSSESNSKSESITSTDEEHLRKRKKKSKTKKRQKYLSKCNSSHGNESLKTVNGNREEKNRKKSKKHDRFYDRSRDIPNQIYFGDVQVPLHVLYSYGVTSESTSSCADSDTDYNSSINSQNFNSMKKNYNSCSSSRDSFIYNKKKSRPGRPSNNILSPSGDDLIKTMRRYLKLAGIKGVKFNRLWEGCKSNQERADKILEVLHEHGLKGEPTSTKCRELRKQIITKREIEDLDPNAIINSEGRSTRRSITRAATRRNYTYNDDGETQQTLKKLRNFVDSDSDIE